MSQTISAKPFLRLVRLDDGRGDDWVDCTLPAEKRQEVNFAKETRS